VSERRIAKVARRTGLCRDLDVLRERLETGFLPTVPDQERKALKRVIKSMARNRQVAFDGMAEALRDGPYLKLLARLHEWQNCPRFSSLGIQELRPWLLEWARDCGAVFLQPGWFATDPNEPDLHVLRKAIKGVRYRLEHLEPFVGAGLRDWVTDLRTAQDH
jgi:CHAD domain-containing protein